MESDYYIQHIRRQLADLASAEPLFTKTLTGVFSFLTPWLEQQPEWQRDAVFERLSQPEQFSVFPVLWLDDTGQAHMTRGFHLTVSTALGPCCSALVFRPGLSPDSLKAQGFLRLLQTSLAGLPVGCGLTGADIDTAALSDRESMRFCQSFINQLYRNHLPLPAPDAVEEGTGPREWGYLLGQARMLDSGSLTPPIRRFSADLIQGWGLACYMQEALHRLLHVRLDGKSLVLTGSTPATAFAAEKAGQRGAQILAMSVGDGFLHSREGLPLSLIRAVQDNPAGALPLSDGTHVEWRRDSRAIWDIPADIYLTFDRTGLDEAHLHTLLARRPLAFFDAACIPAPPHVSLGSTLYSPFIATCANSVFSPSQPDSAWELERQLRDSAVRILNRICAQDPNDLSRGAHLAAFHRLSNALVQYGVT